MKRRGGAICVFAKVPRLGYVKTRLARTLGDEKATALAEAFLEDTLASLRELPAQVIIAFDGDAPARWRAARIETWHQGDGDLGERLERVLGRALDEHAWAIALGADSPGLPPPLLQSAIEALDRLHGPEAVVGPCRDGGYYLLGVRAMPRGALAGVRWSTARALEDTERALARVGAEATRLDAWFDVDEQEDLDQLEELLASGAIHAPATARALRSR